MKSRELEVLANLRIHVRALDETGRAIGPCTSHLLKKGSVIDPSAFGEHLLFTVTGPWSLDGIEMESGDGYRLSDTMEPYTP